MLLWNTVEFSHMTLRLIPKILYAVDVVFFVCKKYRMIYAEMLELRHIQHVVTTPAIRIDNAVRDHLAFDNGNQCGRRGIWDNLRVDPSPAL